MCACPEIIITLSVANLNTEVLNFLLPNYRGQYTNFHYLIQCFLEVDGKIGIFLCFQHINLSWCLAL